MLLSPAWVAAHPLLVAGAVALVLTGKTAAAFLALRASGTVSRTALRAALPLAGVGELSFVLVLAGRRQGLLTPDAEHLFVAIAVLTLAAVPVLLLVAPRLSELLPERPEGEAEDRREAPLSGHVVVAGYGLNGKNVARVLTVLHIPHLVLDPELDRVTLAELNLRAEHVTVPRLLRDGGPQAPAPTEEPIAPGDVLLLVGAHEDLARVIPRLEQRRGEAPAEPRPTPGPAPRG